MRGGSSSMSSALFAASSARAAFAAWSAAVTSARMVWQSWATDALRRARPWAAPRPRQSSTARPRGAVGDDPPRRRLLGLADLVAQARRPGFRAAHPPSQLGPRRARLLLLRFRLRILVIRWNLRAQQDRAVSGSARARRCRTGPSSPCPSSRRQAVGRELELWRPRVLSLSGRRRALGGVDSRVFTAIRRRAKGGTTHVCRARKCVCSRRVVWV